MLAIVIPYYKLTFFEETLNSLSNQTDKRFTVYIGDDASLEDPSNLQVKYQGKFNFVYHRFDTNIGGVSLVKQWERCIAMAGDEEWIMILGDDDVLGENVVEAFYKYYAEFVQTSDLVRYATIVLNEQIFNKSKKFEHPKFESGLQFFIRKLKGGTRNSLSEYVFRKEVYLKYKFVEYESAFYSDDRACLDFSNNKMIFTINDSIIQIRISDQSISGSVAIENLYKAELQFMKFMYNKNFRYFNKTEKLLFLSRLEFIYIKNKFKDIFSWFQLYLSHLLCFNANHFIKFNKRLYRNILNL